MNIYENIEVVTIYVSEFEGEIEKARLQAVRAEAAASAAEESAQDVAQTVAGQQQTLDSYVDETNKPALDAYTGLKKDQLNTHTATKEDELNTHTNTKKSELDSHASNLKTNELDPAVAGAEAAADAAQGALNTISPHLDNINAVAANETNINAVAENEADIDTVAANIAAMNTVAENIDEVNFVAHAEVEEVSTSETAAGEEIEIKPVHGNNTMIADVVVANTTDETLIAIEPINADTMVAGKMYRVTLLGRFSTSSPTHNFILRFKMGTATLYTVTLTAKSVSDDAFKTQFWLTIRTVGASGTYAAQVEATLGEEVNHPTPTTGSVDTTAAQDLTTTIQWSDAAAGNTITLMQSLMETIKVL